jgi:hypothetical protein
MKSMDSLGCIALFIRDLEMVGYENALDDKHVVLFFDLTFDFRG